MRRAAVILLLGLVAGCTGEAAEETTTPPASTTTSPVTTAAHAVTTAPTTPTTTPPPAITTSTTNTSPLGDQVPCGLPPELCRTGTLVWLSGSEGSEYPMVAFTVQVGTPLIAPVDGHVMITRGLEIPYGSGSLNSEILFIPGENPTLHPGDLVFQFFTKEFVDELGGSTSVPAGRILGTVTSAEAVVPGYNLVGGVAFAEMEGMFTSEDAIREALAHDQEIYGVSP